MIKKDNGRRKEEKNKKGKRDPALRFENKSDQMVTILSNQQQHKKKNAPVFSQWLGPRAQRSLCLLFQ